MTLTSRVTLSKGLYLSEPFPAHDLYRQLYPCWGHGRASVRQQVLVLSAGLARRKCSGHGSLR